MTDERVSSGGAPRVEFLICGSPNDAFFSQIAFFRKSLDAHGAQWRSARVVAVFGDETITPVPARWKPHFENIEVHHADPDEYRRSHFYAASDLRFRLVDPGADVSVLSDADTALLRPLPDDFLADMVRDPAVAAVPAHYPFPIFVDSRPAHGPGALYPGMPAEQSWDVLGRHVIGRPIECVYQHPLKGAGPFTALRSLPADSALQRVRSAARLLRNRRRRSGEFVKCPLYPNYGFVAGAPSQLTAIADELEDLHPVVAELVGNEFYGQIAITLAMERAGLPGRLLPLRFNYPNWARADKLYPQEVERIITMHYMRREFFNRHEIFACSERFREFLSLDLNGSNAEFQRHVDAVTGGNYPFA